MLLDFIFVDEVRKWIAEKANLVDVRDLCGQTVHTVSRSVENLQREIQQDTESVRALVQDKLSRSELETHLIPLVRVELFRNSRVRL